MVEKPSSQKLVAFSSAGFLYLGTIHGQQAAIFRFQYTDSAYTELCATGNLFLVIVNHEVYGSRTEMIAVFLGSKPESRYEMADVFPASTSVHIKYLIMTPLRFSYYKFDEKANCMRG